MRRTTIAAALLLAAIPPAAAQVSYDYNSVYDASTRTFPQEACPSWTVYDTATPEAPSLLPTGLLLETSANAENMYFEQAGAEPDMPDPFVVEFRTRWLSGSSSTSTRATIAMGAVTAPNVGTVLYIGNGDVFLLAGSNLRGPAAAVNTQGFHTYRVEVHGTGLVEVFRDEAYLLAGSTYTSTSDFGPAPRIFWGDASLSANGRSEWTLVRHNGHADGCPDVDQDDDGALFEQDCDDNDPTAHPGAPEFFDGVDNDCNGLVDENLDDDADGVPNFADLCADTPTGSGVGPDGCPACATDPDSDHDGVPDSADCNDSDATVYPGATESCNNLDDNCNDAVDEGLDADADGFTSCAAPASDCNDSDATVYPGATESCNNLDDNCNGAVDEGLDADADGFTSCAVPASDCNDGDAAVSPDALELPGNPIDENCDGVLTCDPAGAWQNHGAFVGCVVQEATQLAAQGDITPAEAQALVDAAARSDVGHSQDAADPDGSNKGKKK